jgi:ABC-2 type transport system ATP-binding protein
VEPIIAVEGVVKRFGRHVPALDGVSLRIPAGTIYGLLGPNGAGKTTLIRIMATLLRADAGVVRIAGLDVRHHAEAVRGRIGLAGQYAAVDGYLTGRENIEMVGRLYGLSGRDARTRTIAVLDRIGLGDAADRQVRTYSSGMRHRVDLAASLVGRPQILFLDEPTTGVDPASRHGLWNLIRDLVEDGTTVVLTTQYLDEADQLARRIGLIKHGRLVREGTPDQLKNHTGPAVLELSIPDSQLDLALRALGQIWVHPRAYDRYRGVLVIPAIDGVVTLQRALQALDAAAITPTDVSLHRPTLDDVFLALTKTEPAEPIRLNAAGAKQ